MEPHFLADIEAHAGLTHAIAATADEVSGVAIHGGGWEWGMIVTEAALVTE